MVRVTPFLPLISSAASLLAPTARATAANRQESYAAARHATHATSLHLKRDLLTCDQTYGPDWIQCGDAQSTFCYNPSEGQTCCAQDAGYCDAGAWCAPVAGFCCLDGEDAGTCAREAGFQLPGVDTTVSSTTTVTRSSTITALSATTTSTTLSRSSPSGAVSTGLPTTPGTTVVGGLTWTSEYPATITGFVNGTNSTGPALSSPTFVQVSVAQKEQWTLVWMSVAMGVVGVFMATC